MSGYQYKTVSGTVWEISQLCNHWQQIKTSLIQSKAEASWERVHLNQSKACREWLTSRSSTCVWMRRLALFKIGNRCCALQSLVDARWKRVHNISFWTKSDFFSRNYSTWGKLFTCKLVNAETKSVPKWVIINGIDYDISPPPNKQKNYSWGA